MAALDIPGLVGSLIGKVLDKFPNPADKTKILELENAFNTVLVQSLTSADTAQAEINKIEAASPNWFVAGWRPAVGWVCVAALLQHFILLPWVKVLWPETILPALDMEALMTILLGMLGLGFQRSWEKIRGVSNLH